MERCGMAQLSYWILAFGTVFLVACASGGSESSPVSSEPVAQEAPLAWTERYFQLGKETYKSTCALCHDEGKEDAPKIGDRDAWSSRSQLWSAVLLEHAKDGYLEMPAKGGNPELTDRLVEAAGEYMLSVTFPELPRG